MSSKSSAKVKSNIKNVIKIAIGETKKRKRKTRRRKPKGGLSLSLPRPDRPFPPTSGVFPSTVGNFLHGSSPSPLYPYQILLEQMRGRDRPRVEFLETEKGLSNLRLEVQKGISDIQTGLLESDRSQAERLYNIAMGTGRALSELETRLLTQPRIGEGRVEFATNIGSLSGLRPSPLRLPSQEESMKSPFSAVGSQESFFGEGTPQVRSPPKRPSRPPPSPPSGIISEGMGVGGGGPDIPPEEVASAITVGEMAVEDIRKPPAVSTAQIDQPAREFSGEQVLTPPPPEKIVGRPEGRLKPKESKSRYEEIMTEKLPVSQERIRKITKDDLPQVMKDFGFYVQTNNIIFKKNTVKEQYPEIVRRVRQEIGDDIFKYVPVMSNAFRDSLRDYLEKEEGMDYADLVKKYGFR